MDTLELEVRIQDWIQKFERDNPDKYVESITLERDQNVIWRVNANIEDKE